MDHLPSVEKPYYPIPEVPYLCRNDFSEFNVKDFFEYPKRRGFPSEARDLVQKCEPLELNPFLQEWLYFGLLAKVWSLRKIKVDKNNFVCLNAKGERIITSQRLTWFISRWVKPRKTIIADDLIVLQELQAVMRCVYQYTEALDASEIYGNNSNVELSVHGALYLSLILLQEAIQAMCSSYGWCTGDLTLGLPVKELMFLKVRLRASHWCVSHVETYSNIPSGLYLLGLLPPRREKDHSHCSRAACLANQIDLNTYETQHTIECPRCDFLEVDPDELSRVLCTGYIPVVTFVENGAQHSLKVHSSRQRPRYTAISHVWSDGLGNPSRNALPVCQLRRLAECCSQVDNLENQVSEVGSRLQGNTWLSWCVKIGLVLWKWFTVLRSFFGSSATYVRSVLYPPRNGNLMSKDRSTAFWIDTLCVPVVGRSSNSLIHALGSSSSIVSPSVGSSSQWPTMQSLLADCSADPNLLSMMIRRDKDTGQAGQTARRVAIHRMKDTYTEAEEVLVLDAHLQALGRTPSEVMLGLGFSDWTTRLWTLQEAAFGGAHLFFQFSDAAVSFISLIGIFYEAFFAALYSPASVVQNRMIAHFLNQLAVMCSIWPRDTPPLLFAWTNASPAARLNILIHSLGCRSTSKAEDEVICIEALIGTNDLGGFGEPDEAVQGFSPLETILKRFHRHLHIGVLFTPGARGKTQGLRWAPKTFLSCSSLELDLSGLANAILPSMCEVFPSVVLTAFMKYMKSIDGTNPSLNYVMGPQNEIQKPRSAFLSGDGLCCRLSGWMVERSNGNEQNTSDVHMIGHLGDQGLLFWTFARWRSLIDEDITLPDDWLEGSTAVLWCPFSPVPVRNGILVKLSETSSWDEEYVRVHYHCRVEARLSSAVGGQYADWKAQFGDGEIPRAIDLKEDQGWCVD